MWQEADVHVTRFQLNELFLLPFEKSGGLVPIYRDQEMFEVDV